MKKMKYGTYPLVYPLPAVLLGTVIRGRANFSTLGNCGIISVEPAVIYVSSDKANYTNEGIKQNRVFSVNIPSVDLAEKVDYCGLVSGRNEDKSEVFNVFYEENDMVPMIDECPINMACKLLQSFAVYDMEVFIGEITESLVSEECTTGGYANTKKINPLIYCMDNMYWNIGSSIGKGFDIGKKYNNSR
jgi:flavin reductase (DIM6/NTAB) family NADH-FMN oxidoreductase RutF